jgi:hypothetical protein
VFYRKFTALNPAASPPVDWEDRPKNITELAETNGTEPGADDEEGADLSPGFETATLAELYMRQGHLQMAQDMLEKIVGRDPLNERAKGLLDDIRGLRRQEENARINERVISEISRWLDNLRNSQSNAH